MQFDDKRERMDRDGREPGAGRFPDSLRNDAVPAEEQDALWMMLDEWKAGEPSAGFDANVMARIREEEQAARETQGWRGWIAGLFTMRGLAMAGALATVLLAAVLLRSPETSPVTPVVEQPATELSAQQVESALEDLQMLDALYGGAPSEESQNNSL